MEAQSPAVAAPQNSTTVRSPLLPWPLRAGLSALAAASPRLASSASARLFMTPPHALRSRGRDALARGTPVAFPHRGGRLRAWRFGRGPAVLLLHGWGGSAAQLAPLAEALAAAGLGAVALDGPAHGASSGRVASLVHFADALVTAARATGARAALGHSFGGAAVAYAALRGLPLDAAVIVGAPSTPIPFFQRFADALALDRPRRSALRAALEDRVGVPMDTLELPRHVPAGAPPLLVVHDRGDREVPYDDGAAYATAWPEARLLPTEGLGHWRVLRDRQVLDEAVAFIAARVPRCACGRPAAEVAPEPRCEGCALAEDLWDRAGRRARIARRAG